MKAKRLIDLSYIYCDSDLERAQRRHDKLPGELHVYMLRCFAHKAGLCANPGVYVGPRPEIPEED
jgi:hypothetical protein